MAFGYLGPIRAINAICKPSCGFWLAHMNLLQDNARDELAGNHPATPFTPILHFSMTKKEGSDNGEHPSFNRFPMFHLSTWGEEFAGNLLAVNLRRRSLGRGE